VAVFPLASVAVIVNVVVPIGKLVGALLVTTGAPQLSVTVGEPIATFVASQLFASVFTCTVAGQVIEGTCASTTVTFCVQEAVLPFTSVLVIVKIVTPIGKLVGALLIVLNTPQLSVTVGFPKFTFVATQLLGSVFNTRSAGQVITGAFASVTITCCVHVAVLPLMSVAVIVNVVVPIGKFVGALFMIEAMAQLSVAVALPIFTFAALQLLLAATVLMVAGQTMVGLIVSNFVITKLQVLALLLASFAVKVIVNVPLPFVIVPGAGFCVTTIFATGVQASLTVACVVKSGKVYAQLASTYTFLFAGQVMFGLLVSLMITTKLQVLALLLASIAV
jgi:hypothetical protein